MQTCIDHGAQVNQVTPKSGETALLSAKSCEAIQLLVDAKADTTARKIPGTDDQFNNHTLLAGAYKIHSASLQKNISPEIIALLCNVTPADPIPLADNGCTPLHYLCTIPDTNDFLLKAATLAWWSLQQQNVRNTKLELTPRDILFKQTIKKNNSPENGLTPENFVTLELLNSFDAIIHETQQAQAELPPIPFTPPMLFATPFPPLRKFDLDREKIEKQQLYVIMPEQLHAPGIKKIISDYAGKNTPQPLYPALAFRS